MVKELVKHVVLDFMQMQEFAKDPFIISEGGSIRIKDVDGKVYIDGLSGIFTVSVGHGNAAVVRAMTEQLQRLTFAPPLHATNPQALALAKLLTQVAPPGFNTVKLLSGGSEATEAAMKMARQYHQQSGHPRKFKVLSAYTSYHGATMGALAATGSPDRKSVFEPLAPGFLHVHPAYCYRCPYDQEYGSCGFTCAKIIERTIRMEDPETVAAIIMNPVSINSSGLVVPPPEYYPMIREYCDRHNIVLIFDEIITGFGRLGSMFAAQHYGVTPDIIACGKGMSGGYSPLGAILIQDKVAQAFLGAPEEKREFHHGHTYGGNPLSSVAGLAALQQIVDRNLVENARIQGAHLRARLDAMAEKFAFVGEVRGVGLLQGMEFARDRRTREPFPASARPGKRLEAAGKARGLLMRAGNDFICLAPPLIVTREDIDEICDIVEQCLAEVAPNL